MNEVNKLIFRGEFLINLVFFLLFNILYNKLLSYLESSVNVRDVDAVSLVKQQRYFELGIN